MIKIWAKVTKGDKIIKDMMYGKYCRFEQSKLMDYLVEICHEFDIPTPMVLKSHKYNFKTFNIVRFKASDFIESVDFDALLLENASEDSATASDKKPASIKFDVFSD